MEARVPEYLRSKPLYFLLAIFGFVAHMLWAKDLYAWQDRALAALLLVIFLLVAHDFFSAPVRRPPVLLMLSAQLYVMYGVAQFTQEQIRLISGTFVPTSGAVTLAASLVVVGEVALLMAFWSGTRFGQGFRARLYDELFAAPTAAWTPAVLAYGVLGVMEYYVQSLHWDLIPIEFRFATFVAINPSLALALVFYMHYRHRVPIFRIVAPLMVAAMVSMGLISGMMEAAITPIYVFLIAAWLWGPGMKVKWIIAGAALFIVLNPVKSRYREIAWRDRTPEGLAVSRVSQVQDRFDTWMRAIEKTWDAPFAEERTLEATSSRLTALLSLTQAIDWVPEIVPYREGKGFVTTLLFFVPRALWPDKPRNTDLTYNQCAVDFRITTKRGTEKSTFGLYQPFDGYWDFGIPGAIGYLAATGLLVGLLFGGDNRSVPRDLMAIVFTCVFFQALNGLFNIIATVFTLFAGAWFSLRLMSMASGKPVPVREPAVV